MNELKAVLFNESGSLSIVGTIVVAGILIVATRILVAVIENAIEKYIQDREKKKKSNQRRVMTLTRLAANLSKYGIYFFAVLLMLRLLHVNTSTIIATAGVGSLAIAMGAQVMVKDFINGFFILFEDQYGVGDYVECAEKKGIVIEVGVRVTKIRDFDGSIHIIPNSEIRIVTNRARGRMRAKVIMPIDRSEDPNVVLSLFEEALKKLTSEYPSATPSIWGVTGYIDNGYEITVTAMAEPGEQFDLEYDLRKLLQETMMENDIQVPRFPWGKGGTE
ncbi:small conductance mechanosensitive channel [Peptoniphilus ivorii]|uniref:mechanosensitive ion channel family protein n=1 Tax=Aedoeadaptatus ivorii TaxID=54006 RepID=UPI0027841DBB|nr:mechanosensitive ion channel family protein [Peptoniphilus ivorii]MDQ0508170.1 small conductance mechanosensitive channel [Peptoniphilus ivorii]